MRSLPGSARMPGHSLRGGHFCARGPSYNSWTSSSLTKERRHAKTGGLLELTWHWWWCGRGKGGREGRRREGWVGGEVGGSEGGGGETRC